MKRILSLALAILCCCACFPAAAQEEMLRGFGIRVVPCKFRQDNRDFYIDHSENTMSDA